MPYYLNELINSLGTILVRCHDNQKDLPNYCVKPTNSLKLTDPAMPAIKRAARLHAISILKTEDFAQKFEALNTEATEEYKERIDFLKFIKEEIETLKKLFAKEEPFTPIEFENYQKKIAQLFTDFCQLLTISKKAFYAVKIIKLDGSSATTLSLNGLVDAGWSSTFNIGYLKQTTSGYCVSGDFIIEDVLGRFDLLVLSTEKEIKDLAKKICEAHQEELLAKEELKSAEKKLSAALTDLEKAKTDSEKKDTKIQEQALEITKLKTQLQIQEQKLAIAMEQIGAPKEQDELTSSAEDEQASASIREPNSEATASTIPSASPISPFYTLFYGDSMRNMPHTSFPLWSSRKAFLARAQQSSNSSTNEETSKSTTFGPSSQSDI